MRNEKAKPDSAVGEQNAPPPKVRVPRLTNLSAVRKEMARQYGEALRGRIGSKGLHARIYALKAIRESFLADDLEQRIRALEKANA